MNDNLRIACLLIPHFVVELERQRDADLREKPVVVVSHGPKGDVVLDVSAEAAGVVAGMPMATALSRCPEAAVLSASMPGCQEAWSHILDLLETLSPNVEDGGVGEVADVQDATGLGPFDGRAGRSAWGGGGRGRLSGRSVRFSSRRCFWCRRCC